MSRVDFYILSDDSRSSLQLFACKLAEKAWKQGNRILIQTDSEQESDVMDKLLWTFNEGGFLPHAKAGAEQDEEQPVLISHNPSQDGDYQLMINLASFTPEQADRFARIAEIVNQEPQRKQASRNHYKLYRDMNHELHHHQMN